MTTITTTESALRLGITPRHVRHLIKTGQLPATKQGRDWLIDEDDLKLAEARRRRGRPRKGGTMRYFSEVHYADRIRTLENSLPVTRLHVALDATGDNYIVSGDNTGHISFTEKKTLVSWLQGLGTIKSIATTDAMEVRDGDTIKPYVLLSNSHDKSQPVRFGFTPVRVVCNNTLSWAQSDSKSKLIRVYHRDNIKENLDTLRGALDTANAEFRMGIDKFRKLAKSNVNQKDLTAYIRTVLETENETPRERAIMEVLLNGRGLGVREQDRISWWDAYNAINE